MEAAGLERPAGYAAHHIVARAARRAQIGRAVMRKFQVDIDDAANGVYLPQTMTTIATGAYHPRLHTNLYYQQVNELLLAATSREEVIEVLHEIRERLMSDKFEH